MDKEQQSVVHTLAENLPVLRAKANLTQAEFAEHLGVSRQWVVSVESGRTRLSWAMAMAIILLFASGATAILLVSLGIVTKGAMKIPGLQALKKLLQE